MEPPKKRRDLVDEACVLITVAALRTGDSDYLQTEESAQVLDAIRRSTNVLDDNASVDDIAEYIQGIDDSGLPGLINNVKGITFEIAYAEQENSDGDSIRAELHDQTNHPGTDVRLTDSSTGEEIEVQLKASDSPSYVRQAMHDHPDVPVIVTSEVAHDVDGAVDSGIDNSSLNSQVESAIEDLSNSDICLAAPIAAGGIAAGVRAVPVVKALISGQIDRKTAGRKLLSSCAPSALRAAGLAVALNSPLAPVAGAYILYRIVVHGADVIKGNLKPVGKAPCSENY